MKYPLSILALWLPGKVRDALLEQIFMEEPEFYDIRWLSDSMGTEELKEDFLYIGMSKKISEYRKRESGCWFVTAGSMVGCEDRLITLPGGQDDILPIYQDFRDAFFCLNQWLLSLDEAFIKNESVQELFDISQPILGNPMVLFDTSFAVLASTDNLSPEDGMIWETVQKGGADVETILWLQNIDRTVTKPIGNGIFYQKSDQISGAEELFIHLERSDHVLLARLNMQCREITLNTGLLKLLSVFIPRILRQLEKQMPVAAIRDLDDYLFQELMEETGNVSQIARVLKIPEDGEYVVLCLDAEKYDEIKIQNVAAQMERMIPMSHAFLYQNRLLVFTGISSSNRNISEFWDYHKQCVRKVCEILNVKIGLSNYFQDLKLLKSFCSQAVAAMQLGRSFQPEHLCFYCADKENDNIYYYSDIAVYDMVYRLLQSVPATGIGSPIYWKMRQYDQEHSTNNCEIMKTYLKNDCEAAPTANELFMHRNSIVYRITKLADSYGLDLKDPQTKLLFLLSSIADELIRSSITLEL